MMDFMRDMLGQFQSITPEFIAGQASFKLSIVLINEMSRKLDMPFHTAAEIVGCMTIKVDDDAYNSDPQLFNDLAIAMVATLVAMQEAYTAELGHEAARVMMANAAKRMTLTYG